MKKREINKTEEEINDLTRYYRLIQYRDIYCDIREEELEELDEIIKRNIYAQDMEAALYLYKKNQFTEDEYIAIYNKHYLELLEAINMQNNKKENNNDGPIKVLGLNI